MTDPLRDIEAALGNLAAPRTVSESFTAYAADELPQLFTAHPNFTALRREREALTQGYQAGYAAAIQAASAAVGRVRSTAVREGRTEPSIKRTK
jgi:hypothetical protein